MGFWTLAMAGGSFILIGAWEALLDPTHPSPKSPKSPSVSQPQQNPKFHIFVSVTSLSFLINSLLSLSDAASSHDRIGSALQLQFLPIPALFFLSSTIALSSHIPFPSSLLNLIRLFAFLEEFILFYMQRKDTAGIENRYFDLLLVPITICIISTLLELKCSESNYPRLSRGVGMILQGTWMLQMGISFYTSMLVHGCTLREKSHGNYTIRCAGHEDYHRGRAIATLQFNCHLAFMVMLVVGIFSVMNGKNGVGVGRSAESLNYRPIGAEMLPLEHPEKFTLDSDNDEPDLSPECKSIAIEKSVDDEAKQFSSVDL